MVPLPRSDIVIMPHILGFVKRRKISAKYMGK
jgi:hypothetical protein